MKIRMNMDSCKNALGTVFLLATAFFVCSTFMSMRSVFADPIVVQPEQNAVRNSRQSTRTRSVTPKQTTASRSVASRVMPAQQTAGSEKTTTRSVGTRTVSSRAGGATRANVNNATSRNVISRQKSAASASGTSARSVRARTTASRVSMNTAMPSGSKSSGIRAGTTYSYLTSKLNTGTYSSIIDSSTGLIAADVYANCLSSYYTCMDEICTARSDTKGRCSCAGRATNFLAAEDALERANEELITLSGQLSLLISTRGKGDDLAAAFSLTDAEKVMNCVSWKETITKYGANSKEARDWCSSHNIYTSTGGEVSSCSQPAYCSSTGTGSNNFGFDVDNIDGSSSDILAQLKAWADAKDLAKQYTITDEYNLITQITTTAGLVNGLAGITDDEEIATLDSLANKWGYKLFEYAHNNVCGRVLDSCFNGIYESCGNPGTITDSDGKTHSKCATSATTNCPFNYNSYISVNSNTGDVVLNERGSTSASDSSVSSCFGYSTTTVSSSTRGTTSSSSTDPYFSIRGPVADARRSIMQKYLLDANSACDVYGNALKQTAQNINYQKVAAQQALQQKRLEFKQEEDERQFAEATTAMNNFNECISEIWDCYTDYADDDTNWTTARIKSYCSQVSQVPHCYETMICSPLQTQLTAVIDLPDDEGCDNSNDYTQNTCRNVVTISEILYGTGADAAVGNLIYAKNSAAIREACLQKTLVGDGETCDTSNDECLRGWKKPAKQTTNN